MNRAIGIACVAILMASAPVGAFQAPVARILEQDSSLNHLIDPDGYETAEPGTLGSVRRLGYGRRPMVLIPGLGFGGDVFTPLMEGWEEQFTMYAVTLPGFGGTPAPPSPPQTDSFGEQSWTNNAIGAISQLMLDEDLHDVVVVGHFVVGTQVALELALREPERVAAVVLLAGSARWVSPTPNPDAPDDMPIERRIANVDEVMAPRWFKTVIRETWDDNNFLPGDYAENPSRPFPTIRQRPR